MLISRLCRGVVFAGISMVFGAVACSASSFSFTGAFNSDDQFQEFFFNLATPSTVTAITFGYAGGTNQAATVIPAGGFDPWLAIFDASGNVLASVNDGACGQVGTDPTTGSCFDSLISLSLSAGTYTLILSESDNQPAGLTLAAGYTQTGNGNFTGSEFGCSNGIFCDANGANRTGNWAVDIDNVASASGVPEPATLLLTFCGFTALMLLRRWSRGLSA